METFNSIARVLFWAFVALMVLNAIYNATPLGRDDSDKGRWGGGRSGVKVVTDDKTGCQYLETRDGGITPRLDRDGKQICVDQEA